MTMAFIRDRLRDIRMNVSGEHATAYIREFKQTTVIQFSGGLTILT